MGLKVLTFPTLLYRSQLSPGSSSVTFSNGSFPSSFHGKFQSCMACDSLGTLHSYPILGVFSFGSGKSIWGKGVRGWGSAWEYGKLIVTGVYGPSTGSGFDFLVSDCRSWERMSDCSYTHSSPVSGFWIYSQCCFLDFCNDPKNRAL